jgi:o-succinylbenzoate synthase
MTDMTLDTLTLEPLRWNLKRTISNAKTAWAEREGIVVRIAAGGVVGSGEASPLPGFSPDSLEDARADLERACDVLASSRFALDGDPIAALGVALEPLGALAPSARFALETALLDARSRIHRVPLWRELGARDPEPIRLSALLAGESAEALVNEAEAAARRGITTGKIKVGRPSAHERERASVDAVRAAMGASFALRLDANGAFPLESASSMLEAFAPAAPEFIEEPVAGDLWFELPPSPIRLAIDESGVGPLGSARIDTLVARGMCEIVVVKLAAVGGFVAASALAKRTSGIPLIVTHMFEGSIGCAASAAFALAFGSRAYASGLDIRGYLDVGEHPIGDASIDPVEVETAGLGMNG